VCRNVYLRILTTFIFIWWIFCIHEHVLQNLYCNLCENDDHTETNELNRRYAELLLVGTYSLPFKDDTVSMSSGVDEVAQQNFSHILCIILSILQKPRAISVVLL